MEQEWSSNALRRILSGPPSQLLLIQFRDPARVFFLRVRVAQKGRTTVFGEEFSGGSIPAYLHGSELGKLP